MTSLACIGEPISWLRLETFAIDHRDAAIASHVAVCPACKHCLEEITGDLVALPPLAVPERPRARSWWAWLVPAMAVAAAAVVLLVLWRRGPDTPARENVAYVKGLGDVVLGAVRERGGVVREDVLTFAPGDRWKLVITCPPGGTARIDVAVTEQGSTTIDRPLAPATLPCGNRMVLPGAFALTGSNPNRICATIASDEETAEACLTITPE